jgi:capsid assembly protease
VDSPGGQVSGIDELSKQIFDARGSKPVVAVANHLAASAAYWIATAADELVVSPSAEVGSIGVFAAHEQLPNTIEGTDGSVVTLISVGKYKTEMSPYEPLTKEARASIYERVADHYGDFIRAVARNRGVKPDDVRNGFGEGRIVGAKQAVSLGMADRVATLEETIQRLQSGRARRRIGADGRNEQDIDFRKRRMRLNENTGSVEPGKAAP